MTEDDGGIGLADVVAEYRLNQVDQLRKLLMRCRAFADTARGASFYDARMKMKAYELMLHIDQELGVDYTVKGDWLPTPENINALPAPLRQYIHDLETMADPAGIVRQNALIKDECRMFIAKIDSLIKERDT